GSRPAERARTGGATRQESSGDWRKSGNAANCKPSRQGGPPECNWYDAMAYCGGRLPTVAQLEAAYKSECTGGRKADTCTGWYWSSQESGASGARTVNFYSGSVFTTTKDNSTNRVRCAR
ncbi:MAG: hypothetical protein FD189_2565, partial [Elusimicrobia bacterium]